MMAAVMLQVPQFLQVGGSLGSNSKFRSITAFVKSDNFEVRWTQINVFYKAFISVCLNNVVSA